MNMFQDLEYKLTSIRKFYFLEYFYILLKSVDKHSDQSDIFNYFKNLKDVYQLGESKYKKLGTVNEDLTENQLNRYRYTFNEILEEAKVYNLIISQDSNRLVISQNGKDLLQIYEEQGLNKFNENLFSLMEKTFNGFHYLVRACYIANPSMAGLLIFPIYSPPVLNLSKSQITSTKDIINYTIAVYCQLEKDISKFLKKNIPLEVANDKLLNKLKEADLISSNNNEEKFNQSFYNKILKRIRDYWLNYFLTDIYKIKLSISYFDIWSIRGKQLGIVNTTEFYPDFNGRIVYPISIITKSGKPNNVDFKLFYEYHNNEQLFIHEPDWLNFQDSFITTLYESYHDLKSSNRSYFINLTDLRDIVCYKLKISQKTFTDFLANAYQLNLIDQLKIKISLEVDKLPEETKAIYLKREPIVIDGKPRNIIAIDLKK